MTAPLIEDLFYQGHPVDHIVTVGTDVGWSRDDVMAVLREHQWDLDGSGRLPRSKRLTIPRGLRGLPPAPVKAPAAKRRTQESNPVGRAPVAAFGAAAVAVRPSSPPETVPEPVPDTTPIEEWPEPDDQVDVDEHTHPVWVEGCADCIDRAEALEAAEPVAAPSWRPPAPLADRGRRPYGRDLDDWLAAASTSASAAVRERADRAIDLHRKLHDALDALVRAEHAAHTRGTHS